MRPSSFAFALPLFASLVAACGPTVVDAENGSSANGVGGSSSSGSDVTGGASSVGHSSGHSNGNSAVVTTVTTGPVTTSVTATTTVTSTGASVSDVYPAPHPAAPQAITYQGPIMSGQKIVPIFFSSDDPTITSQLKDFIANIGGSNYWATIGAEYGVGASTALPPIVLTEAPPTNTSDGQIQSWLAEKIEGDPTLPQPDGQTIYVIFYPDGTNISLQGEQSCSYFGGYHNSTQDNAGNPIIYAVVPRCTYPGMDTLETTTGSTSHELFEAATDPLPEVNPAYLEVDDANFYWGLVLGGELGDLCAQTPGAFTTFPGLDYTVQRTWSNASAAASHDPCIPNIPGQVYFAGAPVLTDDVPIDIGDGFPTVHMKGVIIPVGQSKTIDVDLFSDGPTNGDFQVQVVDASQFTGDTGKLQLSLDRNQGQNGEKLHLTITPKREGMYGFETFIVYSTQGNAASLWVGLVSQ